MEKVIIELFRLTSIIRVGSKLQRVINFNIK